jgi:tetratricopeptide (TPR) repeat protein
VRRLALALAIATLALPARATELAGVPSPVIDGLEAADRRLLRVARERAEALAGDPGTAPEELARAYGELGKLYLVHDFTAPAAAAFEEAARLAPAELAWHYYLGVLRQREGDLAAARRHLERARTLRPGDLPVLLRLAETSLDGGDLAAAKTGYAAALSEDSESAAAHHALGQIAYEEQRWRDAVAHFERALALQPGASSIHHPLGLSYRRLRDLEAARRHLEQNRHDPVRFPDPLMDQLSSLLGGARPHLKAGTAAAERGDLAGAIASFRRALAIEPAEPLAHYNLALALTRRGEVEAGLAHFRMALELDPEYRDAHFNLATALGGLGRHGEAAEHYRRAAEIDPLDHRARLEWAAALARVGRFPEAAKAFGATVERVPESVEARFGEAMALLLGGQDALARARLEEGVHRLPESRPLLHALARVLAASEDGTVREPRRALELASRVFQTEPSLAHAETVAMAQAATGDFGQAVAWQTRAVEEAKRRELGDRVVARLERVLAGYARGEPLRSPWSAQ